MLRLLINIVISTPVFNVPYAPNPSFTGRQDVIAALDQHFAKKNKTCPATIKKVALCGLGGIG